MGSRSEWPQSLKDFANRTFAACTEANRAEVSEELKALIFKSFQEGTIYTTDWDHVELESLKKNKKKLQKLKKRTANGVSSPAGSGTDDLSFEEQARREKRARRFENDEIQRQREEDMALRANIPMAQAPVAGPSTYAAYPAVPPHAAPYSPAPIYGAPQPYAVPPAGPPAPMTGIGQQPSQWSYGATVGPSAAMPPAPIMAPQAYPPMGGQYGSVPLPGMNVPPASFSAPHSRYGSANGAPAPLAAAPGFNDADVADPNVIDWDEHTVVGTSTKLEKPYLRLTSAPDPKTVRPLPVLQQTLELLKKKWKAEQNYAYICDQFKSMRQDLTVQRIKNAFTVKVYEIHARIALEKGDLGEYNQCQSQLRVLYAYHLPGSVMEFLAYRILYLLHTRNRREVNALMTELEEKHKKDPAVKHALAVRSALVTGNYHRFFGLYLEAPNMNAYIMDHFVERERVRALLVMASCFRPSCPLSFVTSELAFTDTAAAYEFLEGLSAGALVEPTPAEVEAAPKPSGGFSKGKKNPAARIPLELRKWDAKAALPALTAAAEKHRKVDIKGQI